MQAQKGGTYKLKYFAPTYGRGEACRQLCAHAGIDLHCDYVDMKEWPKIKEEGLK